MEALKNKSSYKEGQLLILTFRLEFQARRNHRETCSASVWACSQATLLAWFLRKTVAERSAIVTIQMLSGEKEKNGICLPWRQFEKIVDRKGTARFYVICHPSDLFGRMGQRIGKLYIGPGRTYCFTFFFLDNTLQTMEHYENSWWKLLETYVKT